MSTNKTPNYNLNSWVGTDNVNRIEFNENFNILDTNIKRIDDAVSNHATRLTAVEGKNTTQDTAIAGKISNPASKLNGQVLTFNGTDWVAQTPTVTSQTTVLDSSTNGNIVVNGSELNVYDDSALYTALNGKQKSIFIQGTTPSGAVANDIWVDTNANLLRRYAANKWNIVNSMWVSSSAPSSPNGGDLWLDTAGYILKVWDGTSQWKNVSKANATDITIADAGNLITATTVEGALQEIASNKRNKNDNIFTTIETGSNLFFTQNGVYGLDMNNSDIIAVNGIYFNDVADTTTEGLMFLKSGATAGSQYAPDYDQIKALDGKAYLNNSRIFVLSDFTHENLQASVATPLSTAMYTEINFTGSGQGANWDSVSKSYYVPKKGRYKISLGASFSSISSGTSAMIYIKCLTAKGDLYLGYKKAAGSDDFLFGSRIMTFDSSDWITPVAYVSVGSANISSAWTNMLVELVQPLD